MIDRKTRSDSARRVSSVGPRTLALLAIAAVCGVAAQSLGHMARDQRAAWPRAEDYVFFLPAPDAAPLLAGGYRQVMADITWARALVYYGSSLVGDADFRYLERFIDNVIALDPRFKRVYKWAAYSVTFKETHATQEEYRLAVRYLESGMRAFPDDYECFWNAGIRYFLDLYSEDPVERQHFRERGAQFIEQAMRKKNAPKDLATFAASLRVKLGQKERALTDLREMILLTESADAQEVLVRRYNQLAGEEFPEEARQAKEAFDQRWQHELPFDRPSMYVILGDRPSPIIDFDALATDRDLFGADLATDLDDTRAGSPTP